MSSDSKYNVIIIGGGAAGLKAAETLYSNGIKNILLLEALDRLGGRLHTVWINDDPKVPIELGANWIHGLTNNPLYTLTEEHIDIFFHKKEKLWGEKTVHCADTNGKVYDESISTKMINFFDELVEESRNFYIKNNECPFNSYEEFINIRLEDHIKNDSEELKSIKRAYLRQQSKVLCFEIGCARLTESSVKEYGSYVRFDDINYEFPGGYSVLVKYLQDKLPSEVIKLNHPVDKISINDDNDVVVNCNNGYSFKTQHVIVTSSLNFLKENYKTFLPNQLLNEKKLNSIQSLKMGYVNKFILIYDDMSFYPQEKDSLHILHIENDYDCENYNLKNDWYKKIAKFDRFFNNILRALITGEEAIYVESLSEEEIGIVLTNLIRKTLNNSKIPLPSRVIRTKWCTNPYILGSYTYVTQDTISSKHFYDLSEPLYQNNIPKILFAGEATHEKYYSTAHAAYLSGIREAQRILKFFNNN